MSRVGERTLQCKINLSESAVEIKVHMALVQVLLATKFMQKIFNEFPQRQNRQCGDNTLRKWIEEFDLMRVRIIWRLYAQHFRRAFVNRSFLKSGDKNKINYWKLDRNRSYGTVHSRSRNTSNREAFGKTVTLKMCSKLLHLYIVFVNFSVILSGTNLRD